MPQGDRHSKVVALIRELAATFIVHEANADPMITITNADASSDYKNMTIYITTIPVGREADALIWLKRSSSEMRRYIMKKSSLKTIPHLSFALDVGERHRQHTDEIFRDIENGKK